MAGSALRAWAGQLGAAADLCAGHKLSVDRRMLMLVGGRRKGVCYMLHMIQIYIIYILIFSFFF